MQKLVPIIKDDKVFRICRKCNKELEVTFFDKCSKTKCGFRSICKICRKQDRIENSEIIKLKRREYYKNNKSFVLSKANEYRKLNKKNILISAKKYREENKDKVKLSKKISTNKKYREDGFFRATRQLRKSVRRYFDIKTKSKKTMSIIGCSPIEFKHRIESLFQDWMCWDNYGYGKGKWVIDHIIPLSSAKNEDELHLLCHYTNLQPLSWEDNMLKGNKLNY